MSLPWFFQLVHAADIFVVHDDVQWIKGGWINRNRTLLQGEVVYLTLPVRKLPHDRQIGEYEFAAHFKTERHKLSNGLRAAYAEAPFFSEVMPVIERCLFQEDLNVSNFAVGALMEWCRYLGLQTKFAKSSDVAIDRSLAGQGRVLALCSSLQAVRYVNLIGGREIYQERAFADCGFELRFVETRPHSYPQVGGGPFVERLSIIDVAMNNPLSEVRRLLTEYNLVRAIDKSESVRRN